MVLKCDTVLIFAKFYFIYDIFLIFFVHFEDGDNHFDTKHKFLNVYLIFCKNHSVILTEKLIFMLRIGLQNFAKLISGTISCPLILALIQ